MGGLAKTGVWECAAVYTGKLVKRKVCQPEGSQPIGSLSVQLPGILSISKDWELENSDRRVNGPTCGWVSHPHTDQPTAQARTMLTTSPTLKSS